MSLNSPNRIPENYGLRIAVSLIAFFLIMRILGFGHLVELRVLNIVILAVGIFLALKKFKATHSDHLNYFRGLITGVATGGVAAVTFGLFLFIYMKLDIDLMKKIVAEESVGHLLNPYVVAFIVVLEGFFSGLLVTFVILNWIATDEVASPVDGDDADLESTPGGR